MKYLIKTTLTFDKWLSKIKDRQAVQAILMRLARAEEGNLGDAPSVGDSVNEMRIFIGKGYRIYFTVKNNILVLLLNGGIKSNKKQQQADIELAKKIMRNIEE